MPDVPPGATELQPGVPIKEGYSSVIIDGKYYQIPPPEQPPSTEPIVKTTKPVVTPPPTEEEPTTPVTKIPPPPVPLTAIAQRDYEAQYAKEHGLPPPQLTHEELTKYQEARGYTEPGSGILMPFVPGYDTAPESQKIPGISTRQDWENLGTPTGKNLLSIVSKEIEPQGIFYKTVEDWRKAGSPTGVSIGTSPTGIYDTSTLSIKVMKDGQETTVPAIRVGLDTDNPITIELTDDLKEYKDSNEPFNEADPNGITKGKLYSILVNEGIENFNRAINASNFIVQQEQKRLDILQARFENTYTKMPYQEDKKDVWIPNTLLNELQKAQDPQSKEVYRLLTTVGLKEAQDYAKQINDKYDAQQRAMDSLNRAGYEILHGDIVNGQFVPRDNQPGEARNFEYYYYLINNKNNPQAIKNVQQLVTDNDSRISLIKASQLVIDTQNKLQSGVDIAGLANAMTQNGFDLSFRRPGDILTSRMSNEEIVNYYNNLSPSDRIKVTETYINDPNNRNQFAQFMEGFNLELAKNKHAAAINLPAGYVSAVLTPIAKGLTNQPLIAQDWQSMGLNIALLSIPVLGNLGIAGSGLRTFGQVTAKGIGLGAGAIMTGATIKDAVDQIQGTKPFDPVGLTISTAFDALILGSATKSSIQKATPIQSEELWARGGMWDDALGKHEVGDANSVKVNVSAITEATKAESTNPSVPTTTRIGEAISDIKTTFSDIPDKVAKVLDDANKVSDAVKQEVLTGERTTQITQNTVKSIKEVADAAKFVLEQSVKEGIRAIDEANSAVVSRMTKAIDDAVFNIKPEMPSENLKPILINAVNKLTDGMMELKVPEGQILKEGQVPQRINYEIQDNARVAINETLSQLKNLLTKEGVDIKQTQIERDIIQLFKDARYQLNQLIPNIGKTLGYVLDTVDSIPQVVLDQITNLERYSKSIDNIKSYSKTLHDSWVEIEKNPEGLNQAIQVKYGSLITDPNRALIEGLPKDISNSISKIFRFFENNEALDIEKVNPKDISNIRDDISQTKFNLKLLGYTLDSTLYKTLDAIDNLLVNLIIDLLEGRTALKPVEYVGSKLTEISNAIKARDFATAIEKTSDIDTTIIQRYQAEQNGKVLSGLLIDIANAIKSKDTYTLADRANQLERFADDVAKRNPSQAKAMDILKKRAIDLQKNPSGYTSYFDSLSPEDKVVVLEGLKNTEKIVNTHRSFIMEGTRPLTVEDIAKPLGDKYLIGKEPQIEGAPKVEYVNPEEARLTFEIAKDRLKIQELQNKEDTSPMDYFNLQKRINDNVAKLAEIRKSTQPSVNFNDRLNDRLLELGWKPEEIDRMSDTEKLTKVIKGEKPTPPDALDKMWGVEPEKPIEPMPEKGGGVGVLEKTKVEPKTETPLTKEETVTEVKQEAIPTEKVQVPVKTEEKTETAKPSISIPTSRPTETPFVVPGIKAGQGYWVLTWEEGKFGWVWYQPKDVPAGFMIDETAPAMEEAEQIRLQQELARMTPEQAQRFLERDLPQKGIVVLSNRFPSINLQPAKAPSPMPMQEPAKVPEPTPFPTPTAVATPTPTPTPTPVPTPTPEPTPTLERIPEPVKVPVKPILKPPTIKPPTVIRLPKKEEEKQRIVENPPEGTIILIQGNPMYKGGTFAPMYKVVPPPYEDMFTTRQTPKGYIDYGYSGEGSAFKSIQIIGGKLTKDVENLDLGIFRVNMKMVNGKPEVTYAQDVDSNVGSRGMTVGMGKNQIPIEEWETAKAQGIPFEEFVRSYQGHKVGESHPVELLNNPNVDTMSETELENLIDYVQSKGMVVNFVEKKVLQDYAAMNPEAAKVMGWKDRPNEIELRQDLPIKEQRTNLQHEIIEMNLMKSGLSYYEAHLIALRLEATHLSLSQIEELAKIGAYKVAHIRENGDINVLKDENEILIKKDNRLSPPEEQESIQKSSYKKRIISKKYGNSDRAIIV